MTRTRAAELKLARQHPPDAWVECQAAIAMLNQLVQEQTLRGAPENPQYLSLVGQAIALSARIQVAQGHPQEARVLRERAVDHLRRAVEIDPGRTHDEQILHRVEEEISPESQVPKPH